jgi:hypothetical protein
LQKNFDGHSSRFKHLLKKFFLTFCVL